MSNDLILAIKNQLGDVQTGLDDDTIAVAGSGAQSKRISIKGGVFRKFVAGKEVGAIEERHMNIVFVKMAHTPSRTYYVEGYKEGEKVSPVCWSTDSKVPDAAVKKPQAPSCDKCQWSVKGTGQNGQGTACRLSWRTAVVLPSDPSGDIMQLVLPAASVFGDEDSGRWPFRSYVQMLAGHNISAQAVVTKMSFDTSASAPRVLFSPVAAVPSDDLAVVREQGASTVAENAVKMTIYHRDEAEAEALEVAEAAPPAAVAAVIAQVKAVETSEPAPVAEEAFKKPVLRQTAATTPVAEKDVSSVIAKWATKGKKE